MFLEVVRIASKIIGIILLVLYLLQKDQSKRLELLMLATLCIAS